MLDTAKICENRLSCRIISDHLECVYVPMTMSISNCKGSQPTYKEHKLFIWNSKTRTRHIKISVCKLSVKDKIISIADSKSKFVICFHLTCVLLTIKHLSDKKKEMIMTNDSWLKNNVVSDMILISKIKNTLNWFYW